MAIIKKCDMCGKEIKCICVCDMSIRKKYYKVRLQDYTANGYDKEYELCTICAGKVKKFVEHPLEYEAQCILKLRKEREHTNE